MKTKLVITDLTRMYQKRVCIAGYDRDHRCIRPVLPSPGIHEDSLMEDGRPIIFPFALVEFELADPYPQPPHTEDFNYEPQSPHFVRIIESREEILQWSLYDSVEEIFAQPVNTEFGYYVMDCIGERSLGTILPAEIVQAIYAPDPDLEEAWDYRLIFLDPKGNKFRLKIVDLTWHYYCDSLRGDTRGPKEIAEELTKMLRSRKVYLRIGLARGWKKFPDRCYLQITGIFTFPDYLDGKTFVDFK